MNKRITITVIFALVLFIFIWWIRSGVGALDELDDLMNPKNLIISVLMMGLMAFLVAIEFLLGMFGFKLPFDLPLIVLSGIIGAFSAFSGIKIVNVIKTPPSSLLVNIMLIVTVIINIILFYHIIGEKK